VPDSDFARFFLILIALILLFALLYKIADYLTESAKERLRLERIRLQLELADLEQKEDENDVQDDPPSRREVRLG